MPFGRRYEARPTAARPDQGALHVRPKGTRTGCRLGPVQREKWSLMMGKRAVLVADTDSGVRDLLSAYLDEWGLRGDETGSFAEMLERLSNTDYALALAEYLEPTHPLRDGWPVLEALRSLAPQTPVVALYSDSPPGAEMGVAEALPRPFSDDLLRRVVVRHLRRSVATPRNRSLILYLHALWLSDMEGAFRVVDRMVAEGASAARVFDGLLSPALWQFGDWWGGGGCRISDEHSATAITGEIVGRAAARFSSAPARGRKAVLACPPREGHDLGIRMLSVLLRLDGWDVRCLGADTPFFDLIDCARRHEADLVGISATLPVDRPSMRQAIALVKQPRDARVILGGQAFTGTQDALSYGADGYAATVSEAVTLAGSLVKAA